MFTVQVDAGAVRVGGGVEREATTTDLSETDCVATNDNTSGRRTDWRETRTNYKDILGPSRSLARSLDGG